MIERLQAQMLKKVIGDKFLADASFKSQPTQEFNVLRSVPTFVWEHIVKQGLHA